MKWLTATVTRVERAAHDIATIYFAPSAGFVYTAGQYITVYFAGGSTPEGKAYSLSSAPHEAECSITVKNIGEYSGKLHALRAGDTFAMSEAYGFFNPMTDKPLVCLGAGCGLAPMWSIVKHELHHDAERLAQVFFSNAHTDAVPLQSELAVYQQRHGRLSVTHHITRQADVPAGVNKGRIDLDACVRAIEGEVAYLVCGSVEFVRDMWQGLCARGVAPAAISTETFFE